MHINRYFHISRRVFTSVLLLVFFMSAYAVGKSNAANTNASSDTPLIQQPSTPISIGGNIISDGQFVYGPNIKNFDLENYLRAAAPHLSEYAKLLYERSEYFSINPKIYLTLLEVHSNLISDMDAAKLDDPFGLHHGGFISQIEYVSNKMVEAYYLHLYSYSPLPVSERNLKPIITPDGFTIAVTPETNAGTYALIAGLAAIDQQDISTILNNDRANGFYQTYIRLFSSDDPLDESNHIYTPGDAGSLSIPEQLIPSSIGSELISPAAAPGNLLQLPYLRGLSWRFGGVHNTSGASTFTDASSLDFYPWPISWGGDTSNMWIVAAASGIPTRYSDCGYKISHSGALNTGWETTYYHLEGAKFLSGSVNQNDKIAVIANTEAEATCTGGSASGPHVHFSLKYNGAYVPINGTPLAGWAVHSGRFSYDVDPNYMWLERAGQKKYPFSDTILSEAPPAPPTVSFITRASGNPSSATNVNFTVTFSEPVSGVDTAFPFADLLLTTTGVGNASITGVIGSGSTYTVTVNTGGGNGTIRLDVPPSATITNLSAISLSGLPFTTGETFTISGRSDIPDLIITNATINPVRPAANQTFEVNITIQNQGGAGGANIIYRDVYIDRDPSTLLDPSTGCPPPGDFFTSDSYASLPAGMSDTKTVTITGGLPIGNHQFWFYVDSRCLVDEGNGANSVP